MRDLAGGEEMDEVTELVMRELTTSYLAEMDRRTDDLIGDLVSWRPTGFLSAPAVTDPDPEATP